MRVTHYLCAGYLSFAAILTVGCNDANAPAAPTTGTLEVNVFTSGAAIDFDPDGYLIGVDTVPQRTVGVNTTETFPELPPGSHLVRLEGLSPNCSVGGSGKLSVDVTAGDKAVAWFGVSCVPITAAPPPAPLPPPPPPAPPAPPAPPPPPPGASTAIASVAGFVIDESDQCIIGARVELIDGLRAGAVFVQTVCGFWDYGEDLGFSFHDLPSGIPVTLRATAKGYKSADKRVTPTNTYSYTTMIVLTKEQ